MEKTKTLFIAPMFRMSFPRTGILWTLMILTIFMLVKESDAVSEADYRASCNEIPVGELTNNPAVYVGQKIKITGEVVVFEETSDQKSGAKTTQRLS